MPKFYKVDMDDFKSIPFHSEVDEWWEGNSLVVEEQFKEDFIAEQVGRFTRHLLSILHEVPIREEHNPFSRIASEYKREYSKYLGEHIVCPLCHVKIDEESWNTNTYDMRPRCPRCGEYEFKMEEE